MVLPVEKIGHTLVVFTANHQRMATATFIIKKGKHIDVYLKLILVKMDIVRTYGIWKRVESVAVKHLSCVKTFTVCMFLIKWRLQREQKSVSEAALVVVMNVYYCFLFR